MVMRLRKVFQADAIPCATARMFRRRVFGHLVAQNG